jgi:aspartate/methionine/tyrosine aminotransferase
MGSQPDDGLYDIADFAAWSRALYRRMPLPDDAHLLFESTIEEPARQLTDVIRAGFNGRVTDRFASVFGRGNPHVVVALAKRYGVAEERIVCATGASNAIAMTLAALIEPGARILIERPGFDVLTTLARQAGAEVEYFDRPAPGFGIDLAAFRKALGGGARVAIISNLHMPSGRMLSWAEFADVASIAAEHGALVLVDEVYADFAGAEGPPCAASLSPNMISVNSLTKVFGLFSLRCGWIIAEPDLARRIARSAAGREFGISKLAHAVAACVLEDPAPFEAHWRAVMAASRPVMERHLAAMTAEGLLDGELPEHGCICFPAVPGESDTRALARDLWLKDRLLLAPGEFFGHPGHVRLGFGLPAGRLDEGLGRLHDALRARRG